MGRFLIGRLPNKSLRVFLILFTQLALLISSIGAVEKPEKIALDARIDHKEMLVLSATSPVAASAVSGAKLQPRASQAFNVYLPVVERSPAGIAPPGDDAHLAIERVNYYRALAGVSNLQVQETIIRAAENHADYYLLNFADPQAWEYGFHGEVGGKPGFSGKWPYDRMQAAGYPWFGSAEVMHFLADPLASVDEWISGVLHRVILLEPTLTCAGYALGKNEHAAVDVLDLGIGADTESYLASAAPYPLVYPADGQPDVPTAWNGNESPDPLPPGAARPVGYPFTLQGVGGNLVVDWAEMRTAQGQVIGVHPNPPLCPQFNCYALIPLQPLSPWSTYTVAAQGSVGGVAFTQSWTFSTGAATTSAGLTGLQGGQISPALPQALITGNLSGQVNSD